MARSDHLAIYKASYDLCLWFEQLVRGFGRFHKFSIGGDLRDGSRRVLPLVVRANARTDKTPVLLELREELESLKAMLRFAFDSKAIAGIATFEHGARILVDIARQNEGWLKSQAARETGGAGSDGGASDGRSGRHAGDRTVSEGRGQNRGVPPRDTAAAASSAP